jgi:hypothetical protein
VLDRFDNVRIPAGALRVSAATRSVCIALLLVEETLLDASRPAGNQIKQISEERMSDHTGGAAFPVMAQNWNHDHYEIPASGGMTLRDYFAAKALPALIAAYPVTTGVAASAYRLADEMLKARQS